MPPAAPNRYFRYTIEDNDRGLVYDLSLEEDFDGKLTAVLIREGLAGRTQRKAPLDEGAWKRLWDALEKHEVFTVPRARVQLPAEGPIITLTLTEGPRKALHKFQATGDKVQEAGVQEILRVASTISVQHFDRVPGLE